MDVESYRRGWVERAEREARAAASRAESVRASLPRLVAILTERFGATGVAVFGSLVRGELRADSDLDLAAAGIPVDRLFAAGAAVERAADMDVDLVPWESATPELRAVIRDEGLVVFGELG